MICINFSHDCTVTNVPADDVGNDVATNMSAELLPIDLEISPSPRMMGAFGDGMSTDLLMLLGVLDLMTALDVVVLMVSTKALLNLAMIGAFGCEACSCCAATTWDCASQARMPSCHVRPTFVLIALPQFPNQEPP